jgi:LPS-assembly protein
MQLPRYLILICYCLLTTNSSIAQEVKLATAIPSDALLSCPIPLYPQLSKETPSDDDESITILSENSAINKSQLAKFSGKVTLLNKQQTIVANELEVNRKKSTIYASGDIHFQNKGVDVFADELNVSQSLNSTTLTNTRYQLVGTPGHGSATKINVSKNGSLSLNNSSFTTCYGQIPDWKMDASEINLSRNEKYVEAYHARFSFHDIPVFYLPYFYIPIGNDRQSGFLEPEIGSSGKSGFEASIPYYWNIANNMDATFTPHHMSDRGTQLLTEFRYLHQEQAGKIDFEYLDSDDEIENNNDARYLARLQHVGNFSDRYRAYIDYTTISDDNYLVDIGSKHYNSNDAYLYQVSELAYFADSWQAKIKLQDFEVLGNHQESYQTLPHIEINSQQPLELFDGFFEFYSEISSFDTKEKNKATAERYHVETGFTLPIVTPAWFLNSEFKVLQTNYQQKNIQLNSNLKENVDRTLPKIRLHGGVNFDRETTLFNKSHTHTIEPQLQYLYIPDKDQTHIGVYDSTTLQDDYNGLFRDKRYSGVDRIASANQYSWGVTSRLLDEKNAEQLRLSVGRIVYFNNSNIVTDEAQGVSADESALAAEVYARINREWQFSSDIQYNTDMDITNKSQTSLDYQFKKNQTVQLNHRYTRDVSGLTLEQISLSTNARINKHWQFIGRITQDLQQKRSLESYAGFQYQSCCWSLSFAYHRHISANFEDGTIDDENRDEFESGFMIRFSIRPQDITDMFNSSIFGYKRPYFLNN